MLKNLRLLELRNNGKLTPELISAYRQPKGLEHIIASTLNQTRIHRDIESIRSDITLEGNMNKETEHDLGFLEDYFPRASLNFDDLMKNVNDEHSKHPIYDTEHQDLLEEDLIRYNNQSETPLEKEHDVKQEVFDENAINEAQGVPMAEGIELRELMDQYKLADLLKISEANDQEDEDGQNDPRANPLASKLGITTDHAKAKKEELDTFKLPLADAQDADLANAGSTASNLLSDIKLDILKQDEQTRDLNPSSEINDPKIKNSALFASIKKSILNKEPIKPIAPQPITDSIQSTFDSISTSSQQPPQEEEEEESEEESGLSEIDDSYLNQYLTNQIDPFDTYLPQELLMDDYLSPDAHDQFLELHQQVGVHRDAGKIAASNLKRYEQEETIVKRSLALTKQSLNSEHNTGILMDAFNERVDRQYEHIDITDSLSTVQSFLKQGSLSDALESEISQKSPELIDRFEPFQRTTLNQILAPGAGMNGQEEIKIIDDGDYLDANHSLLDSDKFHGLLYKDDPMAGAPLKDDRLLESSNSYYSSGELHVEFDPLLPRLGNHLGLKHTMQFYRDQARIEQEEYERTIAPTNTIYHARYVPGPENQSETMNRLTETKLTQLNRIDRVKTDVKDDFDESTIADIEDVLNDDEDDDPTYMSHHILAIAERFAHRAFLHEQYVREPQIPRPYIEDVQSGRVVSKTNWNMVGPIQNYFDGIIEEKVPEGPSSHIVTERLREYGRAVAKNTSMSLKEKIGAMRSLRQALLDNKIYDMELEAPSTIVTGRLTHWHEPRRNPRHTRFSDSVILNRKLYKKKLFVDLKKKEKERRIAEKRARAV
ncbi:hypothetical protein AKO1_011801 [Acrasis kona]|uniref:Uncharacterized protein n=1 Tax=Acrasis kona TaxID=1008807 RepID=A0AAW2Z6N7_9EUKA